MKFCNQCGQKTTTFKPDGDLIARPFCSHCQIIHYQNPGVIVYCIADNGEAVLLRKDEFDRYALPHSYIRHAESLRDAATRIMYTDCNITIDKDSLYLWFISTETNANQVNMVFRTSAIEWNMKQISCCSFSDEAICEQHIEDFSKSLLAGYLDEKKRGKFAVHLEHLQNCNIPKVATLPR